MFNTIHDKDPLTYIHTHNILYEKRIQYPRNKVIYLS